jgi:hypothetical protein
MKRSLLAITLLFAIAFAALPSADAQSCDIPAFVKDLVKKLKDECKKLEGPDAETSKCTAKRARFLELVQKWNTLVGNSQLRLGPREMEFGVTQTGTLVAPADRRFVSQLIEPDKGATITVTKQEATIPPKKTKGICVVNICAIDLDTGAETGLATHTFDSNADIGASVSKSFSASQVGNKVIIVRLDGKGGVGDRFPYSFKSTKN